MVAVCAVLVLSAVEARARIETRRADYLSEGNVSNSLSARFWKRYQAGGQPDKDASVELEQIAYNRAVSQASQYRNALLGQVDACGRL